MENNWKNKTIELLEKDKWDEPISGSQLELTCHQLRKKKLIDLEIEELRVMVGQQIGLGFLLHIVFEKLEKNLLSEGDFYPGDLLQAVLKINPNYWKMHPIMKLKFLNLIKNRKNELEEMKISFDLFL